MWWLLFLLPVCCCSPTNKFDLITSDDPVTGWMGSSVTLPCIVTPALPGSLEVRWHRPDGYTSPVLLYKEQKVQQRPADPHYVGRVSLIGRLDQGNLSLSITNISVVDNGEFVCFVSEVHQGYKDASVHLIVKVRGSPPVLSVTDGGSGQVNVTCVSEGWYPQPTLTWRNQGGTEISSQSIHSATDADGFVRVTSWVLYSPSDSDWLSCSVGLSEEEREESRILPYFSCGGLWKDIIMIILGVTCLLLMIPTCRKVWLQHAPNKAGQEDFQVMRIVLLGKTGVGKGATGNTILGEQIFVSEPKASEDIFQCEMQTRKVHGIDLHVIDTALFDTNATITDIENRKKECIELTYPGVHAFLAINQLGMVPPEEMTAMREKIQNLFGEHACKYTIAIFTHGDKLKNKSIEEFVRMDKKLEKSVSQYGGGCHAFDNNNKKNHSQVRDLLKKIDKMVKKNGGPYSAMHQRDEGEQEQETLNSTKIGHQMASN